MLQLKNGSHSFGMQYPLKEMGILRFNDIYLYDITDIM